MTLVIGTDEAGYGPNLGPLVVAPSEWRVAASLPDAEAAMATAFAAAKRAGGAPAPLWADSKQIYRAGAGFDALERGVVIGLLASGAALPGDWPALEAAVGPISPPGGCTGEWRELQSITLPRLSAAADCLAVAHNVRAALAAAGVSLERIACRGIYPRTFNSQLLGGSNKSDILSQATLDLAATLREERPDEPALIWCDRHGGRKRYGGLVSRHFDTPLVQALEETAARSAYNVPARAGLPQATCRIEFCVGGEARVPVALASMTAKYVRELAMHAFNNAWSQRLPGLQPTAGYPVDAVRWRRDADAAIRGENLAEDDLWRRV